LKTCVTPARHGILSAASHIVPTSIPRLIREDIISAAEQTPMKDDYLLSSARNTDAVNCERCTDAGRMSYGNQQIKVGVSSTGNNAANPSVAHTPLKQLEAMGQIERRVVGLGSPLQSIWTILTIF